MKTGTFVVMILSAAVFTACGDSYQSVGSSSPGADYYAYYYGNSGYGNYGYNNYGNGNQPYNASAYQGAPQAAPQPAAQGAAQAVPQTAPSDPFAAIAPTSASGGGNYNNPFTGVGSGSGSPAGGSLDPGILADHGSWWSCGNTGCSGGASDGSGTYTYEGDTVHFRLNNSSFSNILFTKNIGSDRQPTRWTMDLDALVTDPNAPQALEFDLNQSNPAGSGAQLTIFGTQCDFQGSHRWDTWTQDGQGWQPTGAPCPVWSANTWHHISWEFERLPDNRAHFIAITFDGTRYEINAVGGAARSYTSRPGPNTVGIQLDGRSSSSSVDLLVRSIHVSHN